MSNSEIRYWKDEYENLRRKKKKEINQLLLSMAKANHDWCDYLTEKGLVEDYLKWKGEKDGREENVCSINSNV